MEVVYTDKPETALNDLIRELEKRKEIPHIKFELQMIDRPIKPGEMVAFCKICGANLSRAKIAILKLKPIPHRPSKWIRKRRQEVLWCPTCACPISLKNARKKIVLFLPTWRPEIYIEKLIWQKIEQRLQEDKRISLLTIAKEVDMVPQKLKELLSGIFGDAYTDGWMLRLPEAADLTIRTIEYKVSMDFNAVLSQLAERGVTLQVLECPHCSGKIELPEKGNQTQCEHCGKDVFAVDLYDKFSAILQPLTSTQPTTKYKTQTTTERRKCICGKEYKEHQRYCSNCGASLD